MFSCAITRPGTAFDRFCPVLARNFVQRSLHDFTQQLGARGRPPGFRPRGSPARCADAARDRQLGASETLGRASRGGTGSTSVRAARADARCASGRMHVGRLGQLQRRDQTGGTATSQSCPGLPRIGRHRIAWSMSRHRTGADSGRRTASAEHEDRRPHCTARIVSFQSNRIV